MLGWLEGLCHKIMGDEPAGAGAKDWQKDLGAIVGKCALEVVLASYAWCNYLSQITEVAPFKSCSLHPKTSMSQVPDCLAPKLLAA